MKRIIILVVLVVAATAIGSGSTLEATMQHCGCPAGKGHCKMPCTNCCSPICTLIDPTARCSGHGR